MVDKPEDMIIYNRDFMKQYHDAPNNTKNTVPGHGYFAKLASFEEEHCEKGELYMEYRKMSCQEKNGELCEYCRATDFVSPSPATPTPRNYVTTKIFWLDSYQISLAMELRWRASALAPLLLLGDNYTTTTFKSVSRNWRQDLWLFHSNDFTFLWISC